MTDLLTQIAAQFGLLPLYAVIIALAGFNAGSFRQLITVLFFLCGIYITMFKAFNLGAKFGPVNIGQYLPVSPDIGNMISAVVFVCVIGVAAYGVKRMFVTREA